MSRAQLRIRLRGDGRGDAFGLGERQLSVEKRPRGEFAGLGAAGVNVARPGMKQHRIDDAVEQRRIAGHLQFDRIFAGVGVGGGEHQRQNAEVLKH